MFSVCHLLQVRPRAFYPTARCTACEAAPLWGCAYRTAQRDATFCARCAAAHEQTTSPLLLLPSATTVPTTTFSPQVAEELAIALTSREGPLADLLRRLAQTDVANERRSATLTLKESTVDRSERALFGEHGHPFLALIPPPFAALTFASTTDEILAAVKDACPHVYAVAVEQSDQQLFTAHDEPLPDLLEAWADFALQHTEGAYLVYLATMLLSVLATPPAFQSLPPGRGVEVALLPDFLREGPADDARGLISYFGKQLLFCSWLSLHQPGTSATAFVPLGNRVFKRLLEGQRQPQGHMTATASAIGGIETVYCIPLLQMNQKVVPCRQQECQVSRLDEAAPWRINVFVSHAWRTSEHPDPKGGDWLVAQRFLWSAILVVVDTITFFVAIGVTMEVLAERISGARNEIIVCEHPMGGMMGADFLHDVLRCALEEALPIFDSTEPGREAWCVRIADRIQIWFDFVSLPQSPRSPEETTLFRRTLANLADLQLAMHSLIVSPESDYTKRAWCVAEWLLSGSISTPFPVGGEEDDDEVLPFGMRSVELKTDAFCSLVDVDKRGTEEVLDSLGLRITNGKSDSAIVCRILWESARKAVTENGFAYPGERQVLLASGTVANVRQVLEDVYREGFSREMFAKLTAVTRSAGGKDKDTRVLAQHGITLYWYVHEPRQGENVKKCFQRDLGGLFAAVSSLALSRTIAEREPTVRVGFTTTTVVKKEPNVLLSGFSSDSTMFDIADLIIPMTKGVSPTFAALKRMLAKGGFGI